MSYQGRGWGLSLIRSRYVRPKDVTEACNIHASNNGAEHWSVTRFPPIEGFYTGVRDAFNRPSDPPKSG